MPEFPKKRRFGPPGGFFNPDNPDEFKQLIQAADEMDARERDKERRQQELTRQVALFRSLIDRSVIRFSHADNLKGHIATENYTPQFLQRHNSLLQAKPFGNALVAYDAAKTTDSKCEALEPAYRRAKDLGGFLELYTEDLVRNWMRSPRRLFAYASGNPINPNSFAEQATIIGGDIHLEIPEDDPQAELAVTLPHYQDNGDDLFDPRDMRIRAIYDEIQENHAIAGTVRDLAADDENAHLGFASVARATAFEHVKAMHRKNPIKYMVAELFSITGIQLQSGKEIRIQAPFSPIANIASMIVHARSKKYPALLGWRLRGKESPVYLEGDDTSKEPSKLLVDWHALVHTL